MNNLMKVVLIILALVYFISPDVVPGHIDDLLVVALTIAAQKRIGHNDEYC